ncbi:MULTISPECIES: GNAT family N-acetyltransferase [unclassified Shinella]|uniref:GNAT family N-acetyltransferase n=1 Tax=unclassified Shinella TaxID=2643062 RepID=UPI00225DBDF7|nr:MULTISPECIES: GNAT family N-acetyltransferase [unclassified Shinella]MCO5141280.1 GNAT family N-acetyltransferase [Shinella sp.]MDC7254498.1 GNAT family N-acetyltransferase [Shinella sp. YE25]CAI0337198.1 IAA acetyltransferase [Rhizobiaceae bacterium]CAK7255708.1 IAA acetyltransferase [Shinella sp. WSC3-e]
MAVTLAIESPLDEEVRALVAELNTVLLALSPPEACYHLTVEQMAEPTVTVWIARDEGTVVGCGALKRHSATVGEVKRMFTRPDWQGQGIGRRILGEIQAAAEREGLETLVLETGDRHPAAWAIYEKAGFTRCGPVLDYPDSPYSIFYQKQLRAA